MLKGVPTILCPELLKTLDEMGHNDILVLGDGNFPGSGIARAGGVSSSARMASARRRCSRPFCR